MKRFGLLALLGVGAFVVWIAHDLYWARQEDHQR